jgi:hypothetical protein
MEAKTGKDMAVETPFFVGIGSSRIIIMIMAC